MRRIIASLVAVVACALCTPAWASCPPPYSYPLTNGTTANGSDVIGDLNDLLNCLAPLASPSFTGSVGIGTASPAQTLHVSNSSSIAQLRLEGPVNNGSGMIFRNGAAVYSFYIGSQNHVSNGLEITPSSATGNTTFTTPAVTVLNTGLVGIGTTSPATALHVVGTIRQTNCTTAIALYADTSGNIICNPSDARLKNILGTYSTGLEALAQITPRLFTFKATAQSAADTFVHAGFIAQEVMPTIPEAVARQRNGFYALDTTAILAATVNSVKELKGLADKQAVEVARLTKENAVLAATARVQSDAIRQLQVRLTTLERKSRIRTARN